MRFIDDDTSDSLSHGDIYDDMQAWNNRFLEDKEQRKLGAKSLKSYKEAIKSFLIFTEKHREKNIMENVGARFVNRFLISYQAELAREKLKHQKTIDCSTEDYHRIIKQENKKMLGRNDIDFEVLPEFENTLLHRSNVVKMLLKYISENNSDGHDFQSMFHDIITINVKEKKTDSITIREIEKVTAFMKNWVNIYKEYKPKSSLRTAYRDSLMILLYISTGARSAEIVQVKLKDVSTFRRYRKNYYKIHITNGKGAKERDVAVSEDMIKEHLEYIEEHLPSKEHYLSSPFKKGAYTNSYMHPDNIRKFGNDILKILGINKSGLHAFRRAYATKRIMKDKKGLAEVGKELGNTSTVLEKYYLKYEVEESV